jgi:hypothetical protein
MNPGDDPLACVAIGVATRAYLAGAGLGFAQPFRLQILRGDGEIVEIAVASLGRVAELVAELQPSKLTLTAGEGEDDAELLDVILGHRAVH